MHARERLIASLELADASDREMRADRIEWMSDVVVSAGAIMGPADSLWILEEARVCFVDGHFVAALVLCCAFADQVISDELRDRGFRSVSSDLAVCRENSVFDGGLLNDIEALRKIRRGYVHRLSDDHHNRLHNRIRARNLHPRRIMEDDAKLAIKCMYGFHRATLR